MPFADACNEEKVINECRATKKVNVKTPPTFFTRSSFHLALFVDYSGYRRVPVVIQALMSTQIENEPLSG